MSNHQADPHELRERIGEDALTFRFSRSPGPGGQNVNKVNTKVTLLFDLDGSDALTDAEKRRIRAKLPGRISNEGELRVTSSKERTQRANREAATERFYELIAAALTREKARKPTRIPRAARRRRLDEKRIRGEKKRMRARVDEP